LNFELGVQGHHKWYHSTDRMHVPIHLPL